MDDRRLWPALTLATESIADPVAIDLVSAALDDYAPIAIEDLTPLPLPPGGLWDPTYPPPPEPPPSPLRWRAFFSSAAERDGAANALHALAIDLAVVTEDVPDDDWAARSQRELTAISAGAFVVAPPWDIPHASDQTIVVIEPSRGFGTGHHASTRLCLRALSNRAIADRTVLDLGTGSGVLAIAAALKSARSVLAVDVDDDAIDAARASHALNPQARGIEWQIGDFREREWGPALNRQWELILANLTGGMLRASAERIVSLLAPGGRLIVSGFDRDERPDVERALRLRVEEAFEEDTWVGLVLIPDP